jgi:hypothetical protein
LAMIGSIVVCSLILQGDFVICTGIVFCFRLASCASASLYYLNSIA